MSRDTLHDLIDRIPEEELPAAKRFLEYLVVSPAYRAALSASPDDEPANWRREWDSNSDVVCGMCKLLILHCGECSQCISLQEALHEIARRLLND
jgi:hypothetical protein